jgi:hypothetical protein
VRKRVPLLAAGLTAGLAAAAVLVPAGPASATMLDVAVTCDPASRTVSAAASATPRSYLPGSKLTVVFRMLGGSHVSATAAGPLAAQAPLSVPVTADGTGAWTATGYLRPWSAAGQEFYFERIRVSVLNATTGLEITGRETTCHRDERTALTFACDPDTGAVDVRAAGVRYGESPRVTVRYYVLRTFSQATADSPTFIGQTLGPPDPSRTATVPVAPDGTWSDPGIQRTTTGTWHYAASEYLIVVSAAGVLTPYVVGRGEGLCVSADRRTA